jgi:hypothetical protein
MKKEYRSKNKTRSGSIPSDIVGEKKKFFKLFDELNEESRMKIIEEMLGIDAKFIKTFTYDRIELTLDGAKLQDIVQLNQ